MHLFLILVRFNHHFTLLPLWLIVCVKYLALIYATTTALFQPDDAHETGDNSGEGAGAVSRLLQEVGDGVLPGG